MQNFTGLPDPIEAIAETANSPFSWLIFARRLLHSAFLLDQASDKANIYKNVQNVALMCAGMGVECYLKAYYVANGGLIHDGKSQKKFGSHDLAKMAESVSVPTTDEQEKMLHYLSMWVRVKGRYPVPLKLEDMSVHPQDKTHFPFDDHRLIWNEQSDCVLNEFVKSLEIRIAKVRGIPHQAQPSD